MKRLTKVNLASEFAKFTDLWTPQLVGRINDFAIRLVKVKGEFVWHKHESEDELFLIIAGQLKMNLKDSSGAVSQIEINPGEFFIVPKGTEHCPAADVETHLILVEPEKTAHKGDRDFEPAIA